MNSRFFPATLLVLLVALAARCAAHGDLHDQIVAVTAAIEAQPKNGELYFKRAELRRAHEEYTAALTDYEKADASLSAVQYGRGLAFAALHKEDEALAALDLCVAATPAHFNAFAARARIRTTRGETGAGVADFDRAIALAPSPDPDLFLDRAKALTAAKPPQLEAAAVGLRAGLALLGDIVSLGLALCDIEVQRSHFDAALAVLDRLRARSQRQETWLARRGEILLKANRPDEAAAAFREVRTSLDALPVHLRNTRAMQQLEASLQTHLPAK